VLDESGKVSARAWIVVERVTIAVPYFCLLPEDAGQRSYNLRDVYVPPVLSAWEGLKQADPRNG
jgi:hypothetical protein